MHLLQGLLPQVQQAKRKVLFLSLAVTSAAFVVLVSGREFLPISTRWIPMGSWQREERVEMWHHGRTVAAVAFATGLRSYPPWSPHPSPPPLISQEEIVWCQLFMLEA